ncbi:HNH endonuclease signature motif containing protein [Pararhizobium haloflavum]|uniref:HNH endonuclease signature motif containing protein n=1 Tax=Pararhizobium haloflavum TaxID=2037914 RepID=UPI000C196594|nr:HNH endonuclease [Pararhizobium haloflavum]
MKRRRLSLSDKLEIVAAQATCRLCNEPLGPLAGVEYDHAHALALGGADTNDNMRAVHSDCHAVKTNGKGGTSYGSDKHAIAKVNRLTAAQEEARRQMLARADGAPVARDKPKTKWPKRRFEKRRKHDPAT